MPQEINRPSKQRKKKNGKESKSTDGLTHSHTHKHTHDLQPLSSGSVYFPQISS